MTLTEAQRALRRDAREQVPVLSMLVPLPPTPLHPNSRPHWRTKAEWTKVYRALVMGFAYNMRPVMPITSATARLTFRFTAVRRRDRDNLQSWMKAGADGLTDAAWWTDDSAVTWLPPRVEIVGRGQSGVLVEVWGNEEGAAP